MVDELFCAEHPNTALVQCGPVLLLDVGAVVLLPGAAAGEGDPALPAVVVEALVDALAAIIAVEAEEARGARRSRRIAALRCRPVTLKYGGLTLSARLRDVQK